MERRINDLPKDGSGRPLRVFGEMPVDEYQRALNGTFQVEVLPVSQAALDELKAMPDGRLELHPRISVPGIVDLVPTVFDPRVRLPVFKRRDRQRAEGI